MSKTPLLPQYATSDALMRRDAPVMLGELGAALSQNSASPPVVPDGMPMTLVSLRCEKSSMMRAVNGKTVDDPTTKNSSAACTPPMEPSSMAPPRATREMRAHPIIPLPSVGDNPQSGGPAKAQAALRRRALLPIQPSRGEKLTQDCNTSMSVENTYGKRGFWVRPAFSARPNLKLKF